MYEVSFPSKLWLRGILGGLIAQVLLPHGILAIFRGHVQPTKAAEGLSQYQSSPTTSRESEDLGSLLSLSTPSSALQQGVNGGSRDAAGAAFYFKEQHFAGFRSAPGSVEHVVIKNSARQYGTFKKEVLGLKPTTLTASSAIRREAIYESSLILGPNELKSLDLVTQQEGNLNTLRESWYPHTPHVTQADIQRLESRLAQVDFAITTSLLKIRIVTTVYQPALFDKSQLLIYQKAAFATLWDLWLTRVEVPSFFIRATAIDCPKAEPEEIILSKKIEVCCSKAASKNSLAWSTFSYAIRETERGLYNELKPLGSDDLDIEFRKLTDDKAIMISGKSELDHATIAKLQLFRIKKDFEIFTKFQEPIFYDFLSPARPGKRVRYANNASE